MATKTVKVSDLSGVEIPEGKGVKVRMWLWKLIAESRPSRATWMNFTPSNTGNAS